MTPAGSLASRWNVPLWLGETGENSFAWYADALSLVRRHGIGWCFWPWKEIWTVCSMV